MSLDKYLYVFQIRSNKITLRFLRAMSLNYLVVSIRSAEGPLPYAGIRRTRWCPLTFGGYFFDMMYGNEFNKLIASGDLPELERQK